jgi:hypothetical protein
MVQLECSKMNLRDRIVDKEISIKPLREFHVGFNYTKPTMVQLECSKMNLRDRIVGKEISIKPLRELHVMFVRIRRFHMIKISSTIKSQVSLPNCVSK